MTTDEWLEADWIGFDIETWGDEDLFALQPWRVGQGDARITTWSVAAVGGPYGYVAPSDPAKLASQLRGTLEQWADSGTVVCTWNALFELAWMRAYGLGDVIDRIRWLDGKLLWKHLTQNPQWNTAAGARRPYSLKTAVAEFFPSYADYDKGVAFDGPILKLLHYNCMDALFTLLLTRQFYLQLGGRSAQHLRTAKIETHSLPMVAMANHDGMLVDEGAIRELDQKLKATIAANRTELHKHGADAKILASPTQLAKLLYEDWGLPVLRQTPKGAPSTDKAALHELAAHDDRARLIQNYREAFGNRKKFVTNILESLDYSDNGRTYPQATVYGTYSGRMTYSSSQGTGKGKAQTGFALHQMKRSKEFRRSIKAPAGHVVVEFDAAGQEFRWMAILSGDPTMLRLCMPGEDPHGHMGSEFSGIDYREVQYGAKAGDEKLVHIRHMGKVANLSLQYRTSAKKLLETARVAHGLDIDFSDAQRLRNTYLRSYSRVPKYWDRQINLINRNLFVENLAGRRVYVTRQQAIDYDWSVGSTAINFPVQGTGADQKYLAMSVLRPLALETESQFLFDLHDGLYFIVPTGEADGFIHNGRELLNNLPYEKAWGFSPPIPLPWDAKVGPNWGDMEEVQ